MRYQFNSRGFWRVSHENEKVEPYNEQLRAYENMKKKDNDNTAFFFSMVIQDTYLFDRGETTHVFLPLYYDNYEEKKTASLPS